MSKRRQPVVKQEQHDIILVDDVWSVIASWIPHYNIRTLVYFSSVCRDAILWIRPCLQRLVRQLRFACRLKLANGEYVTKLEMRYPLAMLAYDSMPDDFCLQERRLIVMMRDEISAWSLRHKYALNDCLWVYDDLDPSAYTREEVTDWSRSLLSVLYCIKLRNFYVRHGFPNISPSSNHISTMMPGYSYLKFIYYRDREGEQMVQRLCEMPNIRVCKDMGAPLPALIQRATTSIKETHTPHEREVIELALNHPIDRRVRSACYAILSESLDHREAKITDRYDMLVIKVDETQYAYIHSDQHAAVKEIRDNCFQYIGNLQKATTALYLKDHMGAHQALMISMCDSIGGDDRVLRRKISMAQEETSDESISYTSASDDESQ